MAVQPIRNEMLINGTWTDVSSYTRGGNDEGSITITRGSSGEQTNLSSGTCSFTLDNTDGRFSNRNPLSPYFGLIGRNVQFRSGMTGLAKHIRMIDASNSDRTYDGAEVATADKAALDVTGDIDIRIDVEPKEWLHGYILAAKYNITSNQRSWALYVGRDGRPAFTWSTDGTSGARIFDWPTPTPSLAGRVALRVTLDVNNGSGGYTLTWYTSDTISGTWTQISQTVTTGGVTSIFSSSASLEVGDLSGAGGRGLILGGVDPFVGRIYGFQMYNGIAGSKVADLSVSSQARGATSWSDGLGNTWTCAASAIVDDEDYRFWGQVDRMPQKWDGTGSDVYVPCSASDIISQLQQGQKPLKSPIYRNLSRYTLDQWNTCEDGADATSLGAVFGNAGTFTNASLSSDAQLLGTAGVLSFTDDTGYAQASVTTNANTGIAFWLWYFKLNAIPAGTIEPLYVFYTGGTLYKVALSVGLTTWTLTATKRDGTVIGTSSTAFSSAPPNAWVAMRLLLTQSGSDISYEWAWYPVGGTSPVGASGTWTSATCGRPTSWLSPSFTGKSGMRMAHMVLNRADVAFSDYTFTASTDAYTGEDPAVRFGRLAGEEGYPFFINGHLDEGPNMGPQGLKTIMDLWQECADVSGGMMFAPRDKFGVELRTLSATAGRATWLLPTIDYSAFHLTGDLSPDEVSSGIVNDATVSKPDGTFRRYVKTTGPLNVNLPSTDPNGVGAYEQPFTRNVDVDADLLTLAEWEVGVSTWNELRYPTVELQPVRSEFTSNTTLTNNVTRFDLGDAFTLANLPAWLPPEDVDLLIRGYTETYSNLLRKLVLNCTPYGPYDFARYYTSTQALNPKRWTSNDTTLVTSYAAGVSPISITTVSHGNRWSITTAPFDAVAGAPVGVDAPGERFTCLWITNAGSIATTEGGMETGISGWTSSGTMTLTQDTTQFHAGTKSIKGVVTGSPATATILNNTQVTVSASTSYTATIWVYTTSSVANVNISVSWYTSGNVFLSTSTGVAATVNGAWTQFTVTATSPGTAGLARYGVIITGSPVAGTTIYGDDFDIYPTASGATSLGPYVQKIWVTRAVNGIAMTLPSGGPVYVFDRFPWGR